MGMPKTEVKIGSDKYSFYLVPAREAYLKIAKYGGNFSKMVTSLLQHDTDSFNEILDKLLNEDEIVDLFETFIGKRDLFCNGNLINNLDEHFAGHASDMYKLLFKAIEANDKDFFTSLPTLIENLVGKITEKLQANSLPNQDEISNEQNKETIEALNNLAKKAKEGLGSIV